MPISGGELPAIAPASGLPAVIGGIGINAPPPAAGSDASIEQSLQEAQSRPLDFPATERAMYVRAMVKRTAELKTAGRATLEIRALVPEFARDYPYLFDMLTQDGGYDAANLNTMLTMLDRMGQGDVNHHQATVIVGQRLAQKYIRREDGAAQQQGSRRG